MQSPHQVDMKNFVNCWRRFLFDKHNIVIPEWQQSIRSYLSLSPLAGGKIDLYNTMISIRFHHFFTQTTCVCKRLSEQYTTSFWILFHIFGFNFWILANVDTLWPIYMPFGEIICLEYAPNLTYRIVPSTNTWYYSENQLFDKRSQYIRTENPLHKQS